MPIFNIRFFLYFKAMEVIDARSAMLSNLEVSQLLKEVKQESKQKEKGQNSTGLSTVVYQSLKYLEEMPCRNQSAEDIGKFAAQLKANNIKVRIATSVSINDLKLTSCFS